MTTERKKMGFEKFLSVYFSNLGKFTLVNLIFAVPLAVAFLLCLMLCRFLLPQATTVVLPLAVILAAPFYSGVVVVSKNIYYDRITSSIFKEFVSAVKENFKAYLVHGVVAYVAFVGCYHGIVIYNYLAQSSPIFYVMFFVSLVLALFMLFLLYGVTQMSAFFDLKLKDVYKNSALMTLGEIKNHFFATIGNLAYLAVLTLPVMLILLLSYFWGPAVTGVVTIVYLAAAVLLLVPAGISSITTACLYPDMKRVITGEAKANIEAIRKEDEEEKLREKSESEPEFSDIDKDLLMKSTGEYVFYNGKMIKKSVIIEELKEREGQ